MKIVKVPITEVSKAAYFGKDKAAWKKVLDESESMTSEEFWKNEWKTYHSVKTPMNWFFIVGEPKSIVDELIKLKIGDTNVYYPSICERSPEDLIESRIDWDELKEHADDMYYFIERLYDYI